ncbi:esterase [Marinomonas sp. UCMA 3892]|jgi:phospholipase/carboxylesterase|uniref:Phospholipase/Carboxylesterase n=1 Tax=Marinomonas sp. (strain MWYL1) TaxID=400668 RepID=A6VRJ2_MARMS|nr:esterase [Marinomonas sp. UCMA 3892]NLU97687.1 esterase [Marinomonas sp. UCMA 3892]
MSTTIVIQEPSSPARLFLLFHGVGATPQSLAPLGEVLSKSFPTAAVVSIQAPDASDFGQGYQWFSVQGVTEENRVGRIEAAMPVFVETVKYWQKKMGLGAEQTTLIGFSQGAIMSLSSTQMVDEKIAEKIVSLSGRFATLPKKAANQSTNDIQVHFIHGDQDNVIDYRLSQLAHEALRARGVISTYDLIPHLAHSVDQTVATCLLLRL